MVLVKISGELAQLMFLFRVFRNIKRPANFPKRKLNTEANENSGYDFSYLILSISSVTLMFTVNHFMLSDLQTEMKSIKNDTRSLRSFDKDYKAWMIELKDIVKRCEENTQKKVEEN